MSNRDADDTMMLPVIAPRPTSTAYVGNSWFMHTVICTKHKNSTHAMNAGDFTAILNGPPRVAATSAPPSSAASDSSP